jgi:hypothetical protein
MKNYFKQKKYVAVQVKIFKILCLQGIHTLIFRDTSQTIFVQHSFKTFTITLISNLNIISPFVLNIYLFNHKILLFFHFNLF